MTYTLKLEVEEVNQILGVLGDQPFVKVAQLIVKIQEQAKEQADKKEKDG